MDLDLAVADGAWAGAVLLHPHPDYGGDRHNIVVEALFRALPAAGVSTVRFDFASADVDRGVADTMVAADALLPTLPMFVVGYSFGAGVAARVTDERVAGWVLVAPVMGEPPGSDPRPMMALYAEHDQFVTPPPGAEVIAGADHFMAGASARVAARVVEWLRQVVPAA